MGIGRRSLAALGLALLPLLLGSRLGAQGVLLAGRAAARIHADSGGVPVGLHYRLVPDPGTPEVPFSVLIPDPIRLSSLTARLGEDPGPVGGVPDLGARGIPSSSVGVEEGLSLEEVRAHYWEGSFRVPDNVGQGDTLSLSLGYTVEGAQDTDGRITLPLVAPRWAPVDPGPTTFQARIDVPPGLTVAGSFPTSVLKRPPAGEGGAFEVGLQGVPSALVLWTTSGEAPILTLERVLDLLVVASLLLLGALGLRFLAGKDE